MKISPIDLTNFVTNKIKYLLRTIKSIKQIDKHYKDISYLQNTSFLIHRNKIIKVYMEQFITF